MKLFLTMISLMAFLNAECQPIVWSQKGTSMAIGLNIAVLEDKAGKLRISDVSDSSYIDRFYRSDQNILHFGFTNSIYWARLDVTNGTRDSLYLVLSQAFLPALKLYYQNGDGSWKEISSGYSLGLENKPIIDHFQIFSLPSGSHTYFLRLQPYVHAIPIHLIEKEFWYVQSGRQKMSYGIYAGLLLFAVVINMFLFIALKKTYFLYYSILVSFYLLTSALVMEGYAVYFWPNIDLMFWYKIIPVLDMPAFLLYCISFFELSKRYPHLYRIAAYGALFFCIYLSILVFLPLLYVLLLNQVFALMVFVFGIYTGIVVGNVGNKLGYLFAASYTLWFILILIEATYIQTGYPPHFSSLSYVSTAVFIEAFLLAFLQAKRFQWEKELDQQKQFDMTRQIENMEQDFQREMLNTKLEIQEQTFNSISAEIHDNVGQLLSLAKIQVNIIEQKELKDQQTLSELKENVGQAMAELRLIAKNLSSHYIQNVSLHEVVADQVQRINRLGFVRIQMSLSGVEQKLESQRKLVLYRIIQEGLQNIIKHSKATDVDLLLEYTDTCLHVIISDNGIGFDQIASIRDQKGLGLQNLKARAELVGGKATITSAAGQGTTINISMPHV